MITTSEGLLVACGTVMHRLEPTIRAEDPAEPPGVFQDQVMVPLKGTQAKESWVREVMFEACWEHCSVVLTETPLSEELLSRDKVRDKTKKSFWKTKKHDSS